MSADEEDVSVLTQLYKPLSQAAWRVALYARARARAVPVDSWVSEVNAGRVLFEEVSLSFEQFEKRVIALTGGFLLGISRGAFLTELARSWFEEERTTASATQGLVSIFNADTKTFTRGPDEILVGTAGSSASSKNYRNVAAVQLDPGKSTPVLVRAVSTGAGYNVPPNSITEIKRPLPNCTVSNPPVAGSTWITVPGLDLEQDGTLQPPTGLKGRSRVKWHKVGLGTADAYRYYATSPPPGATSTPVTRAETLSNYNPDTGKFEPRAVALYLASPAGPVTPAVVAMVEALFDYPRRYPLGSKLYVRSAAPVLLPLDGTLTYNLRYRKEDVQSRVAEALALYQRDLTIGGTVYASKTIERVLGSFDDATIDLTLTSMAPVSPGIGKIPVLVNNLTYAGKPSS